MNTTLFDSLSFTFPFRKYQGLILKHVEDHAKKDHKFHIVAPPGSGKTIVGIELIKRFRHPAVVFAPTSTIQLQWRQRVSMFIPKNSPLKLSDIVSTDPKNLKLINVFTYQLLSTPSENVKFIQEAAELEWKDSLVANGVANSLNEAKKRLQTMKRNNASAYKREISKHYKKLKDQYLRDPEFDGMTLLHANAKALIDSLVSSGVKTIVMDEVHHLLDYWALILKELINRIDDEKLIGLTATPPISAGDDEMQNYLSIIGDIDFEIPTPAVVKEGNLAPYQDLVYFCTPTTKERRFIKTIQVRFKELIESIGERDEFFTWIRKRIVERKLSDGSKREWTAFFNSHPTLSVSAVKYLLHVREIDIPGDITLIEEMQEEMTLEDWVTILVDYSLQFLKLSPDPVHHQELLEIRDVLKSFGYVLTESGLRSLRSVTDKILALSESKDKAMLSVLRAEMSYMKDDLRAVVITDFEKQSAIVSKSLEGILDPDAGGAVRAFRMIVENKTTTKLEPILVTGSTMLVDTSEFTRIREKMNEWKRRSGLSFALKTKKTDYKGIIEVTGNGKDWRSNTYVRMVTDLFDEGVIRCIVGTRGLLAEGWDSLSLNTLIDLTSATTSTSVNQLRGRSIRLDPKTPEKLSNNWDIVCIDPDFEKGNQDFMRFIDKHNKYYGLGKKGRILKGLFHVDEELAHKYFTIGFKKIGYLLYNQTMLGKAQNRKKAYKDWKIGKGYSNFEYSATKLEMKDIKFQTVYSVKDSLQAIFQILTATLGAYLFLYFSIFGDFLQLATYFRPVAWTFLGLFVLGFSYFVGRVIKRYITKAFIELPVDSHVLNIGKALLKSLRESQLVAPSQSVDNVRVVVDVSGFIDVYLDYAQGEDARTFSKAMHELLGPVVNQRYLVSRSIDDIDLGFYSVFWKIGRQLFRVFKQESVAYHPVPGILSINKKRAQNFSENWNFYVGGKDLVYTRSDVGRKILLKIRKEKGNKISRVNYDVWK